jgi:hypothetical protein
MNIGETTLVIKDWARHLPVVKEDSHYPGEYGEITISEANRATKFAEDAEDLELLRRIAHNCYLHNPRKKVDAVIVNCRLGKGGHGVAVFVQDGFLINENDWEDNRS